MSDKDNPYRIHGIEVLIGVKHMTLQWLRQSVRRSATCLVLTGLTTLLAGCGAWQSARDTTFEATTAVFIAKVKQMNLVIASRSALNPDARGVPLPVVLRIYQLKDSQAFETATYAQLLTGANNPLKADILGRAEVTLGPGDGAIRHPTPIRSCTPKDETSSAA